MSAADPKKKPVTISEANHEVEPRDPRANERQGARPVPSIAGGAAHALLDDAAGRKALWERLQFSLDGEPDPWFEFEKAQVDLRQFQPVAMLKEAV